MKRPILYSLPALLFLTTLTTAHAQNLLYTLSDVTFNDSATATDFFAYDPTLNTIGTFDITTTNGTGGLRGTHYTPNVTIATPLNSHFFVFSSGDVLTLTTALNDDSPGTYALQPGIILSPTTFRYSGELAPTARVLMAGSLIVTVPLFPPSRSRTWQLGSAARLERFGHRSAA